MSALRMGIYRHYKGPLYQVLGLARDANDADRICVLYIGLQLDGSHLGPRLMVRNYIDGDDPFVSRVAAEKHQDRFTYLGPELSADMLPVVAGPVGAVPTEPPALPDGERITDDNGDELEHGSDDAELQAERDVYREWIPLLDSQDRPVIDPLADDHIVRGRE